MRLKDYFRSSVAFPGGMANIISLGILLLWLGAVVLVSIYHEMWRDEAHSLYVALSADSLWQLPHAIKNEGHPILWYLILWVGYHIINTPVILKIVSVGIGFISVSLFFRFSPFFLWFKILFLLSFLPLYEYTIMARNYGISMLFFFSFASLYTEKKEKPYILAFILFALANTNIHSAIFVCCLSSFWMYEIFLKEKDSSSKIRSLGEWIWPFVIVFFGVFISLVTVIPDNNSIVMPSHDINISHIFSSLWQSALHPGVHFNEIFPGLPLIVRDLLIWILIAGLLVSPMGFLLSLVGMIVLGVFFSIGYSGALRHQGIFFLYLLTIYWIISLFLRKNRGSVGWRTLLFNWVLYGVISIVLILQIFGSYKYVVRDMTKQISSSKAFGQFLKDNKQYHDAIIIGEPDIRLESLPYYVSNPIFVPRINRYEKYIKLVRENKQVLSLGELYMVARYLEKKEKKSVLIALGHFGLSEQKKPYIRYEQYGRKFIWTIQQLQTFKDNTVKIAEFKEDVKNERYEVYSLKPESRMPMSISEQ